MLSQPRLLIALVLSLPMVPWATATCLLFADAVHAAPPELEGSSGANAQAQLDVYLLMGQSNMVGGGRLDGADQGTNPRIRSLTHPGVWSEARNPLHSPVGGLSFGVGPGLPFARRMLEHVDASVSIGLIPCAVANSNLKSWERGGSLYHRALARARAGRQDGVLKGVLWHQGENDASSLAKPEEVESYGRRLREMIIHLREDLGVGALPVVIGELGKDLIANKKIFPNARSVNDAIVAMPGRLPGVAVVSTDDLPRESDRVHFTAAAQRELGRRYAQAMMRLQQVEGP
ncbi:MAG: sialate O-acetylesterase [Deltaproteobacteria bacterium]|nr:sialate O-acetylesterase [Deltaproteobacteria bacterium]MBW2417064.1 sialate O-acetylesterase [Deltaproteobacteria bacterium]